jgi:hypothetical protein
LGWWKTGNGGVIGDPPLNVLDECRESVTWTMPEHIPKQVLARIKREYLVDWGRKPTRDELQDLLDFNRRGLD